LAFSCTHQVSRAHPYGFFGCGLNGLRAFGLAMQAYTACGERRIRWARGAAARQRVQAGAIGAAVSNLRDHFSAAANQFTSFQLTFSRQEV
jgi:hypothetical protein